MVLSDLFVGLLFVVLGLIQAKLAVRLPTVAGFSYGSGFFPLVTGLATAISGLLLALLGGFQNRKDGLIIRGKLSYRGFGRLLIPPILVGLYGYLAPIIGFIFYTFILSALAMWFFSKRLKSSLLVAAILIVFVQFFFGNLMGVQFPLGFLVPFAGVLSWTPF